MSKTKNAVFTTSFGFTRLEKEILARSNKPIPQTELDRIAAKAKSEIMKTMLADGYGMDVISNTINYLNERV